MVSRFLPYRAIVLSMTLLLSGCTTLMDNMVMADLDEQSRQYYTLSKFGDPFKNASDAQAVRLITRSQNTDQITLGAIIGLWDQRPALLEAALSKGLAPNQPIPNRLFISYPQNDFLKPSPLSAVYQLMPAPQPSLTIDNRAQITPAMLVRDLASYEKLVAAGATYHADTLNAALKIATVYGQTPDLAEHLIHLGADLNAILHPEIPPLIHAVAGHGSPERMAWLLNQGADPNRRFSTPVNHRYYYYPTGTALYSYLLDATPLYFVPTYTPDTSSRQRAVEMARILIDAGADTNATATFSYSIQNDQPIAGWTPLHTYHMHLNQTYGNPELVNFLIAKGANPQALTSTAQTPAQVTGLMERTQQQIVALDDQRRRQQEQQNAQAKQQEQTNSGNLFGKAMAITGLTSVGVAASKAGIDSASVIDIVSGGIADVMTEGRAQGLQKTQPQTASSQPKRVSNNTTLLPPAPGFQTETYRVSCPSGVSNDIPLHYRTQQCRAAMIDFATAYSCNEVNRFEQVHAACDQACGSVSCLQN
ncbi:MAG: hypothetical protein NWP51_07110 [Marinomonas hwangdonensis]|nr:hypothetical protein [Marinomonas hwangdonensis]